MIYESSSLFFYYIRGMIIKRKQKQFAGFGTFIANAFGKNNFTKAAELAKSGSKAAAAGQKALGVAKAGLSGTLALGATGAAAIPIAAASSNYGMSDV